MTRCVFCHNNAFVEAFETGRVYIVQFKLLQDCQPYKSSAYKFYQTFSSARDIDSLYVVIFFTVQYQDVSEDILYTHEHDFDHK